MQIISIMPVNFYFLEVEAFKYLESLPDSIECIEF